MSPSARAPSSRRSSGPMARSLIPTRSRRPSIAIGPKVVGIVHAETSTGAWQPVEEIARIAHDAGALIALDTVTGAGGHSGRDRRLGDRRGLFGHAEMPELPARPGTGIVRAAGRRGLEPAQDEGPKLVSRPDDDSALLGQRPLLSPHRADQHELRPPRGAGAGRRGGPGGPDRAARANGRALQAGLAAMGLCLATVEGHRLPQLTCVKIPDGIDDLTVRRRSAQRVGHRDRRRPGPLFKGRPGGSA